MAEQSIVHIRQARWGDDLTYCKGRGGSISEGHYLASVENSVIARHIASLRMCPQCVARIEKLWADTLKLKRERANK
jgi:hypothetical protein